jgi:hypothetical protein
MNYYEFATISIPYGSVGHPAQVGLLIVAHGYLRGVLLYQIFRTFIWKLEFFNSETLIQDNKTNKNFIFLLK